MPTRRCDDQTYTLGTSLSATGAAVTIRGGEYMFFADGTLTGATVSLQAQAPNGTWVDVQVFTGSKVAFTATPANQTGIDLPAGAVRVALTGGTPTGVNAYLQGLG